MLDKDYQDFPDRFSESWTYVAKLLHGQFVSKLFDNRRPTIFISYAWVDKKDKFSENFGDNINGIPIDACDIQQQIVKIKELLESMGFSVHLDIQSNDHAGPELSVQLKSKIDNFDFRVCALTPMFKAKVEKMNSNNKPYVLREEFDFINELSSDHKTFRFIFVGDRSNAVPDKWLNYLATEQSFKSNMQRLEFIVRKLCVSPSLSADEGINLFNRIWAMQFQQPPTSSYATISRSLPKEEDHDNNRPTLHRGQCESFESSNYGVVVKNMPRELVGILPELSAVANHHQAPAHPIDAAVASGKFASKVVTVNTGGMKVEWDAPVPKAGNVVKDIEGDDTNLVAIGGSNSAGNIQARGNVNMVSTGGGEADNEAALRIVK
ncbi:MAG: toll/interleukin-1 receptor domain-containing protein, partial [Pseudomonadota bacterium]|nr:toll/interleukin-1 receptor domain-containing protein [Pseudomonadota bacterium]